MLFRSMTIGFLTEEDREILVEINGEKVSKYVANSGGYNKVGTLTIPVSLKKGVNSVRFSNPDYFMPDIDYFDIKPII